MDKAIQCAKMVLNTCGFKKPSLKNSKIQEWVMKKKGEEKTNGLMTFANIVLVSAAAKILRAVLVG